MKIPVSHRLTRLRRWPWSGFVLWAVLLVLIVLPVSCFLLIAVTPRTFHSGSQWFTLSNIATAFSGYTGRGILDSFFVATTVGVCSVMGATTIAWLVHRTNIFGRRFWAAAMWLLLLLPTWMTTLGWTDVLQPGELGTALGINTSVVYRYFFGPAGIIFVLSIAALPFCYFVISVGMRGLGSEFEDAARVHGADRRRTLLTVLPIIAPALLSAFVIAFAESISDFGVAFTLGTSTHFPIATFTLFSAIDNFPANFPVASVIAGVLVLCTVPPILLQAKVMRSRSFAVLSGRSRAVRRHQFVRWYRILVTAGLALFMFIVEGLPLLGAVASSFTNTVSFYTPTGVHWTLDSYREIFNAPRSFTPLAAPLVTSNELGVFVATGTVILSLVLAKRLASRRSGWSQRVTDVFLIGSIAIPGVVLGVGYIFFFNQGIITRNFVDLYETQPLVVMALIASSVPGQSRLLTGPVAQIQSSLSESARVHGATAFRAWRTTALPLLSKAFVWAWLLTFTKTISELAVVQILYAPGHEPVSVVIETYLNTVFSSVGAAATSLTLLEMLGVIAIVLFIFRLVTPKGWRRIGEGTLS